MGAGRYSISRKRKRKEPIDELFPVSIVHHYDTDAENIFYATARSKNRYSTIIRVGEQVV
jgi:hypothetical protein